MLPTGSMPSIKLKETKTASITQEPHKQTIQESDTSKMTKLVIITNQNRFEVLKTALNDIGITRMTFS